MGRSLLRSRHRRGSHLYWKDRRQIRQQNIIRANRAELRKDLAQWLSLGTYRAKLAHNAAEAGRSWEEQAKLEQLPIDTKGHALHLKCLAYIEKHGLQRGQSPWLRSHQLSVPRKDAPATLHLKDWPAYVRAADVPDGAALRAIISESLSFPLTAALAARLACVTADPISGCLSLLVLGAEMGAELSGLEKWAELLGDSHGLGDVRSLHVLFCGPKIPAKLDGETRHFRAATGELLTCAFARGAWHGQAKSTVLANTSLLPSEDSAADGEGGEANIGYPQLALAFNSGLAEHASSWMPSLKDLYWGQRIPLACTSYHKPEAELDARSLAVLLGVPHGCMHCMPNPFASRLPHLDELFHGQTYCANAYLSVSVPTS